MNPELTLEKVKEMLINCPETITDLEYLDRGGQKTVFKCKINGDFFALKFCDVTNTDKNDSILNTDDNSVKAESVTLSRARREIEIMNKVDSPHLVKLGPIGLKLIEYNGRDILYFSEELIIGEDLFSILRSSELSFNQTIELAIDMTKAIKQLSSINMVHRDIKPKNIMQRKNGQYVLLDTGIAFDIQGETLTAAFHLVGTKIYMSPEQLSGYRRELDFRSDLFLLGIVLYEAISGTHPFYKPGHQTHQIIANILSTNIVPLSQIVANMPKKLERIVMRLLAKEPHLRFKSCDQLIEQLEKVKEEL
ncbi:serine/threonine-protein kinase [Heyndrickxia oleronia]|uniref:Serine/threonine-protein kinase n=1 Tax=Heyndrickxia oleronia TaxID=38875 RepID=A0AAW6STK4_9BACI|nr:serine/threonine-protein kinase [Heyndrickxia oleronia]MDH5160607.1 serine/threonine-protein kinase [Heyndrickxia oleronia]